METLKRTAVDFDKKNHWNNIYETKDTSTLSWHQHVPEISLNFLEIYNLPKDSKIIDVGGGDSLFVDHLLNLGFSNITVLDISRNALKIAKERLGDRSDLITWIESDILKFSPTIKYDFWHDRATFHFLFEEEEIELYKKISAEAISDNGIMVIGAFSNVGSTSCSGLKVKQQTEHSLPATFRNNFYKLDCIVSDHLTPKGTVQNFIYCSLQRI